MKCNKCTDTPTTVGEVRKCGICTSDGTANEIPKDLTDGATMELALERKPGLGNRFGPAAVPTSQDLDANAARVSQAAQVGHGSHAEVPGPKPRRAVAKRKAAPRRVKAKAKAKKKPRRR